MRYLALAFLSLLHPVAAIQAILQEDPLPEGRLQQHLGAPRPHRRRTTLAPARPAKKKVLIDTSRRRRATQHNIPLQLVMTAKEASVDELPARVRDNVRKTLALNPDLRVRFLDDSACQKFIAANFADLEAPFASEKFGPFRGDICRAAVLALEGGFYADLDLQFRLSFRDLVDNTTTFMSVWSGVGCDIMNALIAVERGSEVMQSVLEAIKAWYIEEDDAKKALKHRGKLMGTQAMVRGLDNLVSRECPGVNIRNRSKFDFDCGPHHQIRLYVEDLLICPHKTRPNDDLYPECPTARATGPRLLHWGIFEPPRSLVAYTRYENCTEFGCGEKQQNERREQPSEQQSRCTYSSGWTRQMGIIKAGFR